MEEITFTGIITAMALIIAVGMVMFTIFGIMLLILDIGDKLRIFWNHEILKHGKTQENPTKISLLRTPFFRIKEKIADKNVVEIIGVDPDLGFKHVTNPIYVEFSKNVIQDFVQGRIYNKYRLREI